MLLKKPNAIAWRFGFFIPKQNPQSELWYSVWE